MADELRRPKVPHEDEPVMAPQLVMEGLRAGLGAAVQMSQQRRQTESDMARLAAQEKQNQMEHDINLQKLEMAQEMLPLQKDLQEAHAEYYRTAGVNRAANAVYDVRFNQQRQSLVNDVNAQAEKLGLTNPRFPTDDPVGYGAAALKFKSMYEHSPEPWLKHTIGQYMATADQQKMTIRRVIKNPKTGTWVPGETPVQVPYWQMVRKLQNPETRDEAYEELRYGGHISAPGKKEVSKRATGGWSGFINRHIGTDLQETHTEPTPGLESSTAKMLQEKSKTTDFSPVPSRVPPAMLPPAARKGTSPTETPFEDEPADTEYDPQASADTGNGGYEETDTDKILGQALKAMKMGANPQLVMARVKERGIDPSSLWA